VAQYSQSKSAKVQDDGAMVPARARMVRVNVDGAFRSSESMGDGGMVIGDYHGNFNVICPSQKNRVFVFPIYIFCTFLLLVKYPCVATGNKTAKRIQALLNVPKMVLISTYKYI
jgi:hypothetical protein